MQTLKHYLLGDISFPGWLALLLLLLALPTLFRIFKWLKHKLARKSRQQSSSTNTETGNIKTPAGNKSSGNENRILKIVAEKGDRGAMLRTIADTAGLNANEVKRALRYLEEKKLVELVSSTSGETCYLTTMGRMYCVKKGYTQE